MITNIPSSITPIHTVISNGPSFMVTTMPPVKPLLSGALLHRTILVEGLTDPHPTTGEAQYYIRCIYSGQVDVQLESILFMSSPIIKSYCSQCSGYQHIKKRLEKRSVDIGYSVNLVPERKAYKNMVDRCHYPSSADFLKFQAAGIGVCVEWLADYFKFADYMGPRPSSEYVIGRYQLNVGYVPGNVAWMKLIDVQRQGMGAVLSPHEVDRIRSLSSSGLNVGQIRDLLKLNVKIGAVHNVLSGKSFKDG